MEMVLSAVWNLQISFDYLRKLVRRWFWIWFMKLVWFLYYLWSWLFSVSIPAMIWVSRPEKSLPAATVCQIKHFSKI
jgi:hypothetical protein